MFSKRIVIITVVIFLIAVNLIFLVLTSRSVSSPRGLSSIALSFMGPFQKTFVNGSTFIVDIWGDYFALVLTARENIKLKAALRLSAKEKNEHVEFKLANQRLRKFLNFQESIIEKVVVAEVIGKDPSVWFKTIVIDKGSNDGVCAGLSVMVPEGIVGQTVDVAPFYAKVLLIIDRNSSVDALVQQSRARGIINGESTEMCFLQYVLRKDIVKVGDTVISSGLDGVYPKGLRIGYVSGIVKRNAGIFQEVGVTPFVDFGKLEEVVVVLK